MNIEVRAARAEDVPGVLPMVVKICAMHERMDPGRFGFLPDVESRYARWMSRLVSDGRSAFFVAEAAGVAGLVGFVVGTVEQEIPIYKVAEFGFVHDLWVEPEFRGAGVGKRLVEAAVARFAEAGVTQVRLETAAENEAARRLFAGCGFRLGSVEMLRDVRGSAADRSG